MKKICLLTSEESFLTNFGAVLQGYALYTILTKKNYKVNIQRYIGGKFGKESKKKDKIRKLFIYSFFELYSKILFRIAKILYKKNIKKQQELFQKFQDEFLTFYSGKRKNWEELYKDSPKADIYICGSDQIWNPFFKNGYNDPGYFLKFAAKNKISYAPSFGVSDIPLTAQLTLKDYLESFDFISVREEAGANIIKKYAQKDVEVVLDPTLLLEEKEWEKIAKLPFNMPQNYILCYRFGNSKETSEKIKKIQEILKLPVVILPLSGVSYIDRNNIKCFEAGPREFIGLIKNADLVCTDSFHATVFSVLMETPFITFLRDENTKKSEGMNSRINNFLRIVDLKERINQKNKFLSKEEILELNFKKAKENLKIERDRSNSWLSKALEGVEKTLE